MARLPKVGGDSGTWGDLLNDFLAQSHNDDGTLKSDAVGAPQLQPDSVTSSAIVDGAIQQSKLAQALQEKIDAPSPELADGAVTTVKLSDGAVTTAKIANAAVTAPAIADGAVTVAKLHNAASANGPAILDELGALPIGTVPLRAVAESDELKSALVDSTGRRLDSFPVAAQAPIMPRPGVKAAFLGDSITHRSNAATDRGWVDQLPRILGTQVVSATSAELGVPGERTDQMLARWDTQIAGRGFGLIFLLGGTNDAGQGRSLAQFAAAVKGIAQKAREAGIPLIIGTVPPRGNGTDATILNRISLYNMWLESWAPGAGVALAPVYQYLSNAGGVMVSGYNDDGTHPETLGHQKIAEAFADAFSSAFPTRANGFHPLSSTAMSDNKVSNPFFLYDSAIGWYEQPGGSGTSPTYSFEADVTGQLRLGKWRVIDFDGTAGAGTRYYCTGLTGLTPGERYVATARMTYEDLVGSFYSSANTAGPAPSFTLRLLDSGFNPVATLMSNSVRKPGPVSRVFTVPAGRTSLTLAVQVSVTAGLRTRFKIGEVGVVRVDDKPDLEALI